MAIVATKISASGFSGGSPSTLYAYTGTYASLPAASGYAAGTKARATDGKGFDVVSDGTVWIPDYSMRVNVQSGTTYTLTDADNGSIIRFTNASDITLTCNTEQAVPGFNCVIEQAGDGKVGSNGTASVINSEGKLKTNGLSAVCGLTCSVAGTFNFFGNVSL